MSDVKPQPANRTPTVAVRAEAGAFAVDLDGKPLRTPAGQALRLPNLAMAEAVAAEVRRDPAKARRDASAMPMLRLAATALDRVAAARDETIEHVAAYGAGELLCYRAERPASLVARQQAVWQPLLDWAAARYGANLVPVAGVIMPQPQPAAALAALRSAVAGCDDLALTALAVAVQTSGSLVIGLALLEGRIGAAEAFAIAELDETYQIEQWGEDEEATRRRAVRRRDLEDAEAFLRLIRPAS